ncbi:hypothetical protein ABENE_23780, partial [Asticcacaulis benevestitus DSM 16100 = ATCC BAA-896]
KGQRLVAPIPHGHWKTMTFIAGLRHDRIDAPWMLDGAMDAPAFKTYLREVLLPTLSKNDVVIMDNLPAHKVAGVRDIIEAIGAKVLYLPPYSPDFNPIEQVFAKLKTLLRKAAERTVDGLFKRIGEILKLFESPECTNYLKNSGYQSM